MKFTTRMTSVLILMFMLSSVLVLQGCGSNKADKNDGCPSGTFEAAADDTITGPPDQSYTVASSFGNKFSGGNMNITPLVYSVHDKDGAPKNKICLVIYTGGIGAPGIFYTDNTYSTPVAANKNGLNGQNIVAVSDASGRVTLYWGTTLPPANDVKTATSGGVTTYTAGTDISVAAWVKVYSGVIEKLFNATFTISGEPGP